MRSELASQDADLSSIYMERLMEWAMRCAGISEL
jgi:hypothetical protein